jgi:acyl carrier protein
VSGAVGSDTLEILKGILREKFHAEDKLGGELEGERSLRELGLDSLDVINFLFSVEEATGVNVSDEAIAEEKLTTLGDFARYVEARR